MKKLLIVINLIILSHVGYTQDIEGEWIWKELDKEFVLELKKENSVKYSGSHSSIFQNGNRMDTSLDEQSVWLTKVSKHVYEGTIKSFYGDSIQKVRITYIPSEDAIEWWIYQDSPGIFYFPRKVKMERVD